MGWPFAAPAINAMLALASPAVATSEVGADHAVGIDRGILRLDQGAEGSLGSNSGPGG